MRIQSPNRYRCDNDFALSVVEKAVSKNPCRVVKDTRGVGVLIRSTAMAKFKRGLDLKDIHGG